FLMPVAVGLNWAVAVQLCPALRVIALVQVPPLMLAKSLGLALALVMPKVVTLSGPPLLLVRVSVWVLLAWPTATEPKSTLLGETAGAGGVPVPTASMWPLRASA